MGLTQKHIRKYAFWALLASPGVSILTGFGRDAITYGEFIHKSGELSVFCLFFSLAATPLRRLFPAAKWTRWLLYHRRAIGVASFGYAALHTAVYLQRKWGYDLILKEGLRPDLMTGWIAMAIFLALAITSNNSSVRALGRRWKVLHRLVYLATALVIAHWALATFETVNVIWFTIAILAVQALRFIRRKRQAPPNRA